MRPESDEDVRGARPSSRVPGSTYRLQLNQAFTLADAAAVTPYLSSLGIGDVYVSPILTATRGAAHGYHITTPEQVNPEVGGDEGLRQLADAIGQHRMGLLLDIVPNHLAANDENPWWLDVLEHGRDARYARYFDIDWDRGGGRVVLPILGAELDEVLWSGELEVATDADGPHLRYHDTRLPLSPESRGALGDVGSVSGDPRRLRGLLQMQHYRLVSWRTGSRQLNYRRFFDITGLVGLRVEDPVVFAARHKRLMELVSEGVVTGFRVDHVDGLRDPGGYLADLQEGVRRAAGAECFYVVVEKILEGDEPLPPAWPVAGTTGYEFLTALHATQVDRDGLEALGAAYRDLSGVVERPGEILRQRKRDALERLFPGEVDGLVDRLLAVAKRLDEEQDRTALRDAFVVLTAAFPVYRAYVRGDGHPTLLERDRPYLDAALEELRRADGLDPHAVRFLDRVVRLDLPGGVDEETRSAWVDAVVRWQQLTGPAMAKGFEDSTFYVYNRLISLNEVGVDVGGLEEPGGVPAFHAAVGRRTRSWPDGLNATSTHDTKRSEDVRARLNVLTEIPADWRATVQRWMRRNEHLRADVGNHRAPDRNEEWLIYQTLVGVWPLRRSEERGLRERIRAFVEKAAREAKVHTTWLDPDVAHEAALAAFVDGVFEDVDFLDDVRTMVERIALPGAVNSLAQVVLKVAAPGVPDFYQGSELWHLALVDPDNRRPVDYELRVRMLEELRQGADPPADLSRLREGWRDGGVKLFVTWRALQARRTLPRLFRAGDYRPLDASGERRRHVLGFTRQLGGQRTIAVATRLAASFGEEWPIGAAWSDTTIPAEGSLFRDALTGRRLRADGELPLAAVLAALPVALLVEEAR